MKMVNRIIMKITTTDKLPDLNIVGLNRILNIHPDVHNDTKEKIHESRKQNNPTPLHPEQEIEMRNYPKYEEAKVEPDSTFLHPAIKSKHELKDWCLSMLGYPLVNVELTSSQFDTAIHNALYLYTKYANFPKRYMLKSSLDYEPGVGIDLSKENVV